MTYLERTVSKCDASRDLEKHFHVSTSSVIIKHIWPSWKEKDMDQSWDPVISFRAILDQPTASQFPYLEVSIAELISQNTTDHRHVSEPSQDQLSPEQFDRADLLANKCLLSRH